MAFNFNWSPLTADAEFYQRAREMLTTALNKSPKPPIIVDDILVTEFNLGSVPPELEILEIGDIAEDRFRGIFKMCYSGDAFLTLKTRVQVCRFFFSGGFFSPAFPAPAALEAKLGAAAAAMTSPMPHPDEHAQIQPRRIPVPARLRCIEYFQSRCHSHASAWNDREPRQRPHSRDSMTLLQKHRQ